MKLDVSSSRPFVIGMVHLEPLPGSPGCLGNFAAVLAAAQRDARALADGGTSLKCDSLPNRPVDVDRVRALMAAVGETSPR